MIQVLCVDQGRHRVAPDVVPEGGGRAEAPDAPDVADAGARPQPAVAGPAPRQVRPVLGRQPQAHGRTVA